MSELNSRSALKTYLNPVYPRSFPDPFVLKFRGEYYAYSTGFADDGNVFNVIRSTNLVDWSEVGGAMKPLAPTPPYYWAPEVTYDNGKFYLYYSVGNETLMEIRVAVSERPDGGFVDAGHRLTHEDFAIDAHVFVDSDDTKYFFYATDFLDYSHIGTGTVVDRMIDWFTLEGNPRPVTRAKYDWQVYDPNRKEKGGVRWHTVEGPAVMKRKGLYYEMFSGGNWQNTTYGVSFAISPQINNHHDEWLQFSDGINVMPILRTLPGQVIGPGHNCVVRGPNNRELYCVYHEWTDDGRVMAIDRLDFAGARIFVVGPSHASQPAPFSPTLKGLSERSAQLKASGDWTFENGIATCGANGSASIEIFEVPPSFFCELTLNCAEPLSDDGTIAIALRSGEDHVRLSFHPIANVVQIEIPERLAGFPSIGKLPDDFDWTASHLVRIEADHRKLKINLDTAAMSAVTTLLEAPIETLSISTEHEGLTISCFELTEGFEELFESVDAISENGWEITGDPTMRIANGELLIEAGDVRLQKHDPMAAFEFTANIRVTEEHPGGGLFGLVLEEHGRMFTRFEVDCATSRITINEQTASSLPDEVTLSQYHQMRIIKTPHESLCYFDDILVSTIDTRDVKCTAAVFCAGAAIGVEMIRLTAI